MENYVRASEQTVGRKSCRLSVSGSRPVRSSTLTENIDAGLAASDSATLRPATHWSAAPSEGTVPDAVASLQGNRRAAARHIIGSQYFDLTMCFIILCNSITIGLDQSYRAVGWDATPFEMAEHGFIAIYLMELLARGWAYRKKCLMDNWVRFDIFLVGTSILTNYILVPFTKGQQESTLGALLVLRTARLLRVGRSVRMVVRFRELFMLVRGLFHSWSTMIHTCLLFAVVIYMFSCVCMEVITLSITDDPNQEVSDTFRETTTEYFRNIPVTMLTMVQFITFDNCVYIYKPLIEEDWRYTIVFMVLIAVFGIVLMNLVTAVIVNSALEQAMKDKDMVRALEENKKKKMMRNLRRVFTRLDSDGSGDVSREEVINIGEDDKEMLLDLTDMSDPGEIFDILDVDGSGELDIQEFCKGIEQIAFSEVPAEMRRMLRQIEQMYSAIKSSHNLQASLHFAVKELMGMLQSCDFQQLGEPTSPTLKPHQDLNNRNGIKMSTISTASPADSTGSPGNGTPTKAKRRIRTDVLPPWTSSLALELRQACGREIRRAVEDGNRHLEAEVRNIASAIEGHSFSPKNKFRAFTMPATIPSPKKALGITSVRLERPPDHDSIQISPVHSPRGALPVDTGFASSSDDISSTSTPEVPQPGVMDSVTGMVSTLLQRTHSLVVRRVSWKHKEKVNDDPSARTTGNFGPPEIWESSGWNCDATDPDPVELPRPRGAAHSQHPPGEQAGSMHI